MEEEMKPVGSGYLTRRSFVKRGAGAVIAASCLINLISDLHSIGSQMVNMQ